MYMNIYINKHICIHIYTCIHLQGVRCTCVYRTYIYIFTQIHTNIINICYNARALYTYYMCARALYTYYMYTNI